MFFLVRFVNKYSFSLHISHYDPKSQAQIQAEGQIQSIHMFV